jgi:hypothetical protein
MRPKHGQDLSGHRTRRDVDDGSAARIGYRGLARADNLFAAAPPDHDLVRPGRALAPRPASMQQFDPGGVIDQAQPIYRLKEAPPRD